MTGRMRRRFLAGWVTCMTILLAASSAVATPKIGKVAPDFSLRDREGTLVRLTDFAYQGKAKPRKPKKAVVLDFFRTDCKPCRKGLPKLFKLHRKFKKGGVQVVMVALLEDENGEDKLDQFLKKNPIPFMVLVDSYGTVAKKYVVEDGKVKIPALFLMDHQRKLRHVVRGLDEKSFQQLKSRLGKLAR